MLISLLRRLRSGSIRIGPVHLQWKTTRVLTPSEEQRRIAQTPPPYKLNLGPGPNWQPTDEHWLSVDVDPSRADLFADFRSFDGFSLDDESVACIYGSHVFEHMSLCSAPQVFRECYRVLQPGGYMRLVLPDVSRSIEAYIQEEHDFELFKRRRERAKRRFELSDYTLFECLREDFLSLSSQQDLLGPQALAHQNAWDLETIKRDLVRAGFKEKRIQKMDFRESQCDHFNFEGKFSSEASADYRSLYLEAQR
jgi:SAM-dependent methyltransferase